jgi:hypothetical protein
MLRINFMRSFINRLRDAGWKNINVRRHTSLDNQALKRGEKTIVCIEQIQLDGSLDFNPQIEGLFKHLIELIRRSGSHDIFLPGGGEIPIPDFFIEYCKNNGIKIHIISVENIDEYNRIDL